MASVTTPAEKLITALEFASMPGTERCELVRGRIVPMVPPPGMEHGKPEANVTYELMAFVRSNDLGHVASGEVSVLTGRSPDTVRGVDILFISHARYAKRDLKYKALTVAPELIVEVLSPSNTMSEMLAKLREYFSIGTKLVWLVDPEDRCVYAYRSLTDIRHFTTEEKLPGDDVLPGFSVPVARFFL